ncbi:MAG: type II toxin-antitoxin system HicB family antitoxin [Phycisphaerales bacterium]|nr:type II toxin-antitoxin system HicB family antitoxin [Phycisphaerales bacterium]
MDDGLTAAERAHLSRPFAPAVLKKAAEIVKTYRLLFERDSDLGYLGSTVEMPTVMGDGKTLEACGRHVLEATTFVIAYMLEKGQTPPASSREGKRDQQLNIRVSAEEKLRLEAAARAGGYRSVSDYLRESGLNRAG